jgi:hypothetical protein
MSRTPVAFSSFPDRPVTNLIDYASGPNPVYNGYARSDQPTFTFTGATVSKAAAASVGFTAHGLVDDNAVYISGATGAGWTALNGNSYRAVRTGADTFTLKTLAGVDVASSGFAGAWDGTITTTAPRTSAPIWYITKTAYSGSNPIGVAVAVNGFDCQIWDNRASLAYN